tara:strand:+ start:4045 stop:4596 length:552 start_codon:yes stop_codon:yes gene_type:complete
MKFSVILGFSVILLLSISACKTVEEQKEKVVEPGKTITFNYAAGFNNGTLFDTTFEIAAKEAGIYDPNRIYGPVTIIYGTDLLFPGLEEVLLGMKVEETRNARIPPEKAYGLKIENSTTVLSKDSIDNFETLEINNLVTVILPDGSRVNTYVTEIGEENITVDLNHPLAGEFIQFAVVVESIE